MVLLKPTIIFITLIFLVACHSFESEYGRDTEKLKTVIKEHNIALNDVSLLIKRQSDHAQWRINKPRSHEQFRPASTSKIAHSLIAIETSTAIPKTSFTWNGNDYGSRNWNKTQTLKQAFQNSTVWVYQSLTTKIGHTALQNWFQEFNYGNANIGEKSQLTHYWLDGPLAISANEQVNFIEKIHQRELGLQPQTYELAIPMMLNEQQQQHQTSRKLYAKTGLYPNSKNGYLGWFVGWLEINNAGQTEFYSFALNINLTEFSEHKKRKKILLASLKALNLWD